ncbi:MAG: DUF1801 domain-containing protein [Thermoguttaceae bacterium]
MKGPERQLDNFIAKYSPDIAALAREAFAKLRALIPHATILVYDNYNSLAVGFGPNERASNAIVSLAMYPKWVSLFFLQGASLPDPDGLLRGSGKKARHLRLPSAAELDRPVVRSLISAALEQALVPIEPAHEGRVIIKSVSDTQRPRRPRPKKGRAEPDAAADDGA